MADRLKDNEDRKLEALFLSDPIPDDGFTRKVVSRIRRRIWIRRLALPGAFAIGAAIALKPLSQLAVTFGRLLTLVPANMDGMALDIIPDSTTVLFGGLFLAALMMIARMLEE